MTDEGVERTPDGRYVVVSGRRWRASDPSIPDPLRQQLVDVLMAARVVGGDWRDLMPTVREVAFALADEGQLVVTQRGEAVEPGVKGPVRVARGPAFDGA